MEHTLEKVVVGEKLKWWRKKMRKGIFMVAGGERLSLPFPGLSKVPL